MKRLITIVAATALASSVLAPAATAENESPNPKQVANQICHEQKKGMDNKSFKELYGGKRAMQTCKRQNRGEAETVIANAAHECKAEREADPATFAANYGDKKNAFGKCVSQKAKAKGDEEAEKTANAARECKAEREADPATFAVNYGERKNAFGKCVSEHARDDEEPAPAPTA